MTGRKGWGRTEFEQNQFDAIYPRGVERHWWNAARNRIVERRLCPVMDPGDRVLEIGCGTGIVVDYLAGRGLDVVGCDLGRAEPASARVAERLHFGVDALSMPASFRDGVRGVLLLDVLEHMPEPRAFLARVVEAYAGVRWVFITLPARQELWSNYDEFNHHFKRYSLVDVPELAPPGAIMVDAGYFFHALWLPARALVALGRDRSTVFRAPSGMLSALHAVIARGFVLEERVVPRAVVGSSLWAAMRIAR